MQKKLFWQFMAASALSTFLVFSYLFLPQSFYSLDDRLRDFLFLMRGAIPSSGNVVIVDVDEKSLKEFGRWPWPRDRIAELLQHLDSYEVIIIGMDMIFPEHDPTSPDLLAKKLNINTTSFQNNDRILAKTLKTTPIVGGYLFLFEPSDETRLPQASYVIIERGKGEIDLIAKPKSVLLNTNILQQAYVTTGFLNNLADSDGVIRSVPLLMRYDERLYLSLSMELLRTSLGLQKVEVLNSSAGAIGVGMGEYFIPTGRFANLHVNFRGPSQHFEYISAADVLNKTVDAERLRGKIVLLGTSAIGLGDIHATPFDSAMAGVEVHANVLDNIIQGDFIALPVDDIIYNTALMIAITFVTMMLFSTLPRIMMLPAFILETLMLYALFMWLLFSQGVILSLLFALLAFVLSVVLALLIDYFHEAHQKEVAQSELKETNATMLEQSKSAAMGEMVGMIAHQWRQPLSSMSAISSKVKLKGQLGKLDSVDKDMDDVVDLTRYLSETIEDFRNFFKEDKSFELTSLEVVVDRSLRFTSHLLNTKDVVVTKNLKNLSAQLNVNEMTQVLVNLIKNAVDAYEERGIKERTLHFEAEAKEGKVTLHVKDTAGGLDEEKLKKIFEKSFSTKGAEGTGLGLYMCKKIVEENHQGSLHVSNQDGGLKFSIKLLAS